MTRASRDFLIALACVSLSVSGYWVTIYLSHIATQLKRLADQFEAPKIFGGKPEDKSR